MSNFFIGYMAAWITACALAVYLLVRHRAGLALCRRSYWRFLVRPWKVATFLVAAVGMSVMAPYTGDPTWDYFDAAFMSVLTYATAPWAIGIVYLAVRGRASFVELYVALCAWMFSASWCYDGYLVLRDGAYPSTWFANIFASSVLYILAGMFWNLDWKQGRGVHFAFTEDAWPEPTQHAVFRKIFWLGLPLMIFVAAMILPFLL